MILLYMLTWLSQYLSHYYGFFRVFDYITFRCILAAITALLFSLFLAPSVIRRLTAQKVGQVIRDDGPKSHLSKANTPTMGGILIIFSVTVATLLWGELSNRFIWISLASLLSFSLIGGIDDYRKLVLKNSRGLPARWKYLWQSIFGLLIVGFLYFTAKSPIETTLYFPFFKDLFIPLGGFYLVWGYFVIVGSSNAVNLTDGLDGLAIMPTVMVAGALAIFAYVTGHFQFAHYLAIPHIPGTGEIAVFCAALVGAGLGFLWFNTYPAQVFMGDIGSLGLGASLGCIALMVRQELVFALMGGVFVLETISVVMQVASFKLTGQRVFRMAPLHHHYELKGWPEPRVIVRFWIISFILVLFGLATLKLR